MSRHTDSEEHVNGTAISRDYAGLFGFLGTKDGGTSCLGVAGCQERSMIITLSRTGVRFRLPKPWGQLRPRDLIIEHCLDLAT